MPRWSDSEFSLARDLREAGHSYKHIGRHLNRPWRAVENKLIWERMSPAEKDSYREKNMLAHRERRERRERAEARAAHHRPLPTIPEYRWHGRCPAFRPLSESDANKVTRL